MPNPRNYNKHINGFTFVELLIIMIILSILAAIGVSFSGRAFDSAYIKKDITQMRNMANILSVFKNMGFDNSTSNNFSYLNSTQSIITFPATNNFGYPYQYILSPTIKVETFFPFTLKPIGVLSSDVMPVTGGTSITIHYRARITQIKNLYYSP